MNRGTGNFLRGRGLSVPKSEGDDQEQIRLVESPEPEDQPGMNYYLDDDSSRYYGTTENEKERVINVHRPVLNQAIVSPKFTGCNVDAESWGKRCCRGTKRICQPKKMLFSLVPILTWLPQYKWKSVSHDIIAGFMVAVMNIPQGMAYAMLGYMPPIVGIYMGFFPVIIYAIFGTSRHISMGTFAVICLMSGKAALEYQTKHHSDTKPDPSIMEITTAITFAVGIFQAVMGVFRLGALSLLLNSELVSGFTSGAAVHVLTSQVKTLLGVSIPRRTGIFKIIMTYIDVVTHIKTTNIAAVIISVITISFLMVYNELLKPVWAKFIRFPLPVELITIIVGTVVSLYFNFHGVFDIDIVNHIPTGLPTPTVPDFNILTGVLLPDGLIISVVAYAISISMAKIFATKHNYPVDANQELIAQGTSNFVGSFFSCGPIAASLSRSLIQEQVGGRTQLTSLFSCFLLVFVLLWIGPFFETLPSCVLSAIILVALKGMFLQIRDLPAAWKQSKLNAFIWLITFLATVLLDIEYGLGIGVIVSVITLIWRSNRAYVSVLGVFADTDLYADITSSDQIKEISQVKIVKYSGSLNFATADNFVHEILKAAPITPTSQGKQNQKLGMAKQRPVISTISSEKITASTDDASIHTGDVDIRIGETMKWLIIDMSGVSTIDPQAAKAVILLHTRYSNEGVRVLLASCTPPVLDVMRTCQVLTQVGVDNIFPSIHDAVTFCTGCPKEIIINSEGVNGGAYPHHHHGQVFANHSESESDNENAHHVFESSVKRHSHNNENLSGASL